MEVIKRKILYESLISREKETYGAKLYSNVSINIFLTQTIEDLGMFTDNENYDVELAQPFTMGGSPNTNNPLVDKLVDSGITFTFMTAATAPPPAAKVGDFYAQGSRLSAYTASRMIELKRYSKSEPYLEGFEFGQEEYENFSGETFSGVSKIFDLTSQGYSGYSFDAKNDSDYGTTNQYTGLLFRDTNDTVSSPDDELGINIIARKANISYISQGWNETNLSLSANAKEEKYLGITSLPEVQSEVFIERGDNNILEPHLRLSEIESLEHLENYNNGSYFNIKKQTL